MSFLPFSSTLFLGSFHGGVWILSPYQVPRRVASLQNAHPEHFLVRSLWRRHWWTRGQRGGDSVLRVGKRVIEAPAVRSRGLHSPVYSVLLLHQKGWMEGGKRGKPVAHPPAGASSLGWKKNIARTGAKVEPGHQLRTGWRLDMPIPGCEKTHAVIDIQTRRSRDKSDPQGSLGSSHLADRGGPWQVRAGFTEGR
jgi:hypothetical protein